LKIFAKIFLSKLPIKYRAWARLGIFQHGQMDSFKYSSQVFEKHMGLVSACDSLVGKTILELGPGDGVTSALLCYSMGAKSILIDAGDFVSKDIEEYHNLVANFPADLNLAATLARSSDFDSFMREIDSEYLTGGLESLSRIESESVDILFSQAVLEHVKKKEFDETMREIHRVLKPDGFASHRIDLRDHLGGGLNNLRFSSKLWESKLFHNSGFYTNRIGFGAITNSMEMAGLSCEVLEKDVWSELPIRREQVSKDVEFDRAHINVKGFHVVNRKK
jgi:SAM-dependent methyltransferase